jgi:hypothetical protein
VTPTLDTASPALAELFTAATDAPADENGPELMRQPARTVPNGCALQP